MLGKITFCEPFEDYARKIKSLEPEMFALAKRIISLDMHMGDEQVLTDVCAWLRSVYYQEKEKCNEVRS